MRKLKLTFIGSGNMARSIIQGLINNNYPPALITAASPTIDKLNELNSRLGIHVTVDNVAACETADVVILCVKPMHMKQVCQQIKPIITQNNIAIISIAAGITLSSLMQWLNKDTSIIRTMPNLPAMVGCGATALVANPSSTVLHKETAEGLMRAVGITVWLTQEEDMDLVTAISGCGPAYFFKIMAALEQAAIKYGLSKEVAHLLITQTALGASQIALENPGDLMTLIDQVKSPGGTTEKALQVLDEASIMAIFEDAILAAKQQAVILSKTLDNL